MANRTFLIDARTFVEALRETDDRLVGIVFAMIGHYLDHGPFEFDASVIAKWTWDSTSVDRMNPEKLAALQPQLERFFEATPNGWAPRRGVLVAV